MNECFTVFNPNLLIIAELTPITMPIYSNPPKNIQTENRFGKSKYTKNRMPFMEIGKKIDNKKFPIRIGMGIFLTVLMQNRQFLSARSSNDTRATQLNVHFDLFHRPI